MANAPVTALPFQIAKTEDKIDDSKKNVEDRVLTAYMPSNKAYDKHWKGTLEKNCQKNRVSKKMLIPSFPFKIFEESLLLIF